MPEVKRKRGSRGGAAQRDDALESPVMKKTRRGKRGKGSQSMEMEHVLQDSVQVESLQSDIKAYLLSLEECLDASDEKDPEEMEMIIQNIYKEIDGCELDAATDFETCRVLEKMLILSNDFQLRSFAEKVKSNVNALIRDPYGSHVLQKLLVIAADVVAREDKGESLVELKDDQQLETMNDFVIGICEMLNEDWIDYMTDTYSSHVLRTLLSLLSGSDLNENKSKKSKKYTANHKMSAVTVGSRKVSDKFIEFLNSINESIMETLKSNKGLIKELAFNQIANPVLQILLSNDLFSQSLIGMLLDVEDVNFLNMLIHDSVGSHLMEKILNCVSPDSWKRLYRNIFKNHLIELSEHPVANYVVQRLIEKVPKEKTLGKILKELSPCFQSFIFQNRLGLLSVLAQSCIRFESLQQDFINQLLSSLGSDHPKQSLLFLVLFNQDTFADYKRPNLQGSLLIQHLLKFKPSYLHVIVNGIYTLDTNSLLKWSSDTVLSRIIESFLQSDFEFKSKKKLLLTFCGTLVKLAKDRIGSHVLDKIWAVSDINLKEIFLQELLEHEHDLLNDFHGKFILSKAHWDLYKRRKNEWLTLEKRSDNRKSLFSEFIQ